MQPSSSFKNPWAFNQQTPGFPHLKSVPPPPIASVLTPPRFQQPLNSPHPQFGKQKQHFRNGSASPFSARNQKHNRGQQHKRGQPWGRGQNKRHTAPINCPLKPVIVAQCAAKTSCDTCDKTFPDERKLAEHLAEHKVCGLEGCQFSAHPKIIANHVEMQHRTGLFKRLILGRDAQEIERWREERKKRFPTKSNLELKQSAAKEREARGERLSEPKGRFNNRGRGQWNQRPNSKNHNNVTKMLNSSNESGINKELNKPKIVELSEIVKTESEQILKSPLLLPRALASLAGNYASSDSDSEGAPKEVPISHELQGPEPPEKKIRVEPPPQEHRREHNYKNQPTVRQQYLTHRRPPTLLQKLLANDIRHERNVILQCVRHIVLNNFFQ